MATHSLPWLKTGCVNTDLTLSYIWSWALFIVITNAIVIRNRRLMNEKGNVESKIKSIQSNKILWIGNP